MDNTREASTPSTTSWRWVDESGIKVRCEGGSRAAKFDSGVTFVFLKSLKKFYTLSARLSTFSLPA